MLELQKFLINHSNDWKEILAAAPYSLTIKEEGNLVLFKYSQLNSDFNYKICKEARGIILEKDTWKIIRLAFFKFFNVDEVFADKINWNDCTATEKIDGSLITLYFYNNEWRVATNSNINAENSDLSGPYKNFKELFEAAAEKSNLDYSKLNPKYNYTFELVSPFNKIVINYNDIKLYHILTRNMETLEEEDIDIGIEKPKVYNLNSEEEYRNFVSTLDETHEGIVIKDKDNNRVKLKTLLYFELHRQVNNHVVTAARAIKIILSNEQSEFLSYFPEYTEYFNKVRAEYNNGWHQVTAIVNLVTAWKKENNDKSRKDFVNYIQTLDWYKEYKVLFFWAYDNVIYEKISKLNAEKIVELFKNFLNNYLL